MGAEYMVLYGVFNAEMLTVADFLTAYNLFRRAERSRWN